MQQERSSFLKKRSKRFLCRYRGSLRQRTPKEQKFFGSFFQKRTAFFLAFVSLASCARPPESAYVDGKATAHVALGTNSVGEACTQSSSAGARDADILCGSWDQPAARVLRGDPASPAQLSALVTASPWRNGLDNRLQCPTGAEATVILGQPALLLHCTRLMGGWPQIAVATVIDGTAYYADGVEPSLPAMERSIGVLSGKLRGQAVTQHQINPALAAQRIAANAFSASDVGDYEQSMNTAASANRAGNYADAERAYNSVAQLQRRVLGPASPALARTLAGDAVQLSNLGRYNEAENLLNQAELLATAPGQTDENALPVVLYSRALHLLNEQKPEQALSELKRSEAGFITNLHGAALIPPPEEFTTTGKHGMAVRDLFTDPAQTAAIIGVVENRRSEAVALKFMNRLPESSVAAASATQIAAANDLDAPDMRARLLRTSAFVAEARGQHAAALTQLTSSATDFGVAFPNSLAYAKTRLLLARRQVDAGQSAAALASCHAAVEALRVAEQGTDPLLLLPCLQLLHDSVTPANAEAVHEDMFEVAELAQGSVTSQQIAEATARLSENARNPKVAALIKERADLKARLSDMLADQQEQLADSSEGGHAAKSDPALDAKITSMQKELADKNSALQAASPNFGSLVQKAVTAHEVMAALRPGEVFCSIMLAKESGWSFLVSGGQVLVAPVEGGADRMAKLVGRVRASLDTETMPPPPFDIAASQELYQALLGSFSEKMQAATAFTVAPTGPLLSLPFGLLLTGPTQPDALAAAPWLVQRVVVSHVPAPVNFVGLRKLAGTSRATTPWFGFGDFRPVSLAQADRAYPPANCGDSATLLAHLPKLPGAQLELQTVRKLTHASDSDQLLGLGFTADAVLHTNLKDMRILHFATHALLSTDLKCQTEPALVTSAPVNAPSAGSALLTSSEVAHMDLDADTVILSACNTGGGAAGSAGESLSGLARSFFFAGARSMLVTHWAVNDQVTAYLVALAVAKSQADPSLGIAGGLAAAQRKMLAEATGDLAVEAHPFYWAPLAVIGDGRASLKQTPPA
jgi:CHAT domain-containing protein